MHFWKLLLFYLFSTRKPSPAPSFYMKDSFQSDAKEIATYLHWIIYGNKLYVQKKMDWKMQQSCSMICSRKRDKVGK